MIESCVRRARSRASSQFINLTAPQRSRPPARSIPIPLRRYTVLLARSFGADVLRSPRGSGGTGRRTSLGAGARKSVGVRIPPSAPRLHDVSAWWPQGGVRRSADRASRSAFGHESPICRSLDLTSWEAAAERVRRWEASGTIGIIEDERPDNPRGRHEISDRTSKPGQLAPESVKQLLNRWASRGELPETLRARSARPRIGARIAAGGMSGEGYRARDTRLGRDVVANVGGRGVLDHTSAVGCMPCYALCVNQPAPTFRQ